MWVPYNNLKSSIPGAQDLLLPFIAVPFVGSLRRHGKRRALERLRGIDDDLRGLDDIHKECTDIDHIGEHAALCRVLPVTKCCLVAEGVPLHPSHVQAVILHAEKKSWDYRFIFFSLRISVFLINGEIDRL